MEADFIDFAVANLNITTKMNDEVYEEVRIDIECVQICLKLNFRLSYCKFQIVASL